MDVREYLFELFTLFHRYRRSLETTLKMKLYLFILSAKYISEGL